LGKKSLKIAVATVGNRGLEDEASPYFGKTKTFTIVTVTNGEIEDVKILQNPAATYEQGAGPVAVQLLAKEGVNLAVGGEIGPGASTLLDQHKIRHITAKPHTKVSEIVKKLLKEGVTST